MSASKDSTTSRDEEQVLAEAGLYSQFKEITGALAGVVFGQAAYLSETVSYIVIMIAANIFALLGAVL